MKVILKKIIGGDRIRGTEIEGTTESYPSVGKPFYMMAPPIDDESNYRVINTSTVKEIISDNNGEYILETLNSTYKLIIVNET